MRVRSRFSAVSMPVGQNVHVAEIAAALVRAGHFVRVYTRRDDARLREHVTMPSGVIVTHIDAGPPRAIAKDELWPYMDEFAARLQGEFATAAPDVVHAHFWMSAYASLVAAKPLGIPMVQTFHALGSEKRRMQGAADTSPLDRIAREAQIIRDADRIIATSSGEIFELCRLGADPRRLKIVPCGVDAAFFERPQRGFEVEHRRPFRAVTLSRLVERKGVADVISALCDVPEAELVVAGGPTPSELPHDREAQRLSQHAIACGVADRVTFVGRLIRTELPRLLHEADAVVCAAWYEPFGIVPLEAMASGVPVIATAVGGHNDTVIDRFTGLHVPAREPRAIASALRELAADPALRARLGAAGRSRAQQRFTWGPRRPGDAQSVSHPRTDGCGQPYGLIVALVCRRYGPRSWPCGHSGSAISSRAYRRIAPSRAHFPGIAACSRHRKRSTHSCRYCMAHSMRHSMSNRSSRFRAARARPRSRSICTDAGRRVTASCSRRGRGAYSRSPIRRFRRAPTVPRGTNASTKSFAGAGSSSISGSQTDASDIGLAVPANAAPARLRDATIVHVGAASAARRWPADRWVEVVRSRLRRGERIVLTGSGAERPSALRVAEEAGVPLENVVAGETDARGTRGARCRRRSRRVHGYGARAPRERVRYSVGRSLRTDSAADVGTAAARSSPACCGPAASATRTGHPPIRGYSR